MLQADCEILNGTEEMSESQRACEVVTKKSFLPLLKGRHSLKASCEIRRASVEGEVSGLERCSMVLRPASVGEPQCGPLGFWNKALLSIPGNYIPLQKQLEICYWFLVDMKHLSVGQQVSMPGTKGSITASSHRSARPRGNPFSNTQTPIKPNTSVPHPVPHVVPITL